MIPTQQQRGACVGLIVALWLSMVWRLIQTVGIGLVMAGALLGIAVAVSGMCGHNVGSLGCTAAWNFDGRLADWMWENVFSQTWWPMPQPPQ